MLFASLINHLAVQQIREPHGNLISHGKGEEEENSGGERAERGRDTLFYFPPFPSRVRLAVRWLNERLFGLQSCLSHRCQIFQGIDLCP